MNHESFSVTLSLYRWVKDCLHRWVMCYLHRWAMGSLHRSQAGKLNFFGTRSKWVVSYIAYTKFHSPRPVFHSADQIFTRIVERASASFSAWRGNGITVQMGCGFTAQMGHWFTAQIRPTWIHCTVHRWAWIHCTDGPLLWVFCAYTYAIIWKKVCWWN